MDGRSGRCDGIRPSPLTQGASRAISRAPGIPLRVYGGGMTYQYKVVEVREKMIGGKVSGDRVEKLLNEWAAQGWQLKAITATDVKGRVGPGGVEGLLVTFERQV